MKTSQRGGVKTRGNTANQVRPNQNRQVQPSQNQSGRTQSSQGNRQQVKTSGKLPAEDLSKIKTVGDYLFMDQYQDSASYPRFEECFGPLVMGKKIDLPSVFKAICGKKKKYITFRRLISSYNQWKSNPNKVDKNLANFYNLLYKQTLKQAENGIGKVEDGTISYNTRNSQNRKAISQLCVITDEAQENLKGLQIMYDDFFKNNLFLNKEDEKHFVSLELNLAADNPTTSDAKESFPTSADRDGITHVGGTIDKDVINFLLFKCRSGKTSFVGKPSGEPFLFGDFGKQLQTAKVGVKEGKMCYFEPKFVEVQRSNPNLDKKPEEVTDAFLGQDKPIYEETILVNSSEQEAEKMALQPLVKDDRFFNSSKHGDKISGIKFDEICPVVNRFFQEDPNTGKKKFKIDFGGLMNEATNFFNKRGERMEKLKASGAGPQQLGSAGGLLSGIANILPKGADGKFSPGEFLQNTGNFDNLIGKLGGIISKDAEKEGKLGLVNDFLGGALGGLSNLFGRKEQTQAGLPSSVPQETVAADDGKLRAGKKKTTGGDKLKGSSGGFFGAFSDISQGIFGFSPFGGSSSGISIISPFGGQSGITSIFSPFGFSGQSTGGISNQYVINDTRRKDQEQRRKEQEAIKKQHELELQRQLNEQQLLLKTKKAQQNWQNFKEKYAKDQGIFVIQTIGAVIKALTLLKNEEMGIPSKYTIEEKLKLFQILKANREIIVMLTKAHKEALRRKEEEAQLQIDKKELEKMKIEEQKRAAEEKKKLEEEKKRREEEKRITQQEYQMEQERKKREEEQRQLEIKIQQEKDAKRKAELQKQEEAKRKEDERKKQEEAKKQKELEEKKKKIEAEKRKAEEEERKKEEEEKKKREEAQKKAEEEQRKKQQQEEAAKKQIQEQKVLKPEQLDEINAKIARIEEIFHTQKLTDEQVKYLKDYYNDLIKDRNAITAKINEEQAKKMAESMQFNPEEAKKNDEEERKRLKEEEDKKIEQKKKEEEAKRKEQTVVVSSSNTEIPKGTTIWRGQKIGPSGQIYTDELFQPIKNNLCPVNDYGKWQFPEDITQEDVDGWEKIKWERAENIFGSKNYQVFYEGIKADDIIQGGLGDCYFLSAIAALCKFPELIERLFFIKEKSNEHCYGVYYRVNGIWRLVLVDDYIPCYGSWGKNFAFSSTNGNELWVILAEKAWAKLNGNYAKAIGGEPHEVFEVITNAYSEKVRVKKGQENAVWQKLANAEKNGFIMTAGTSGDTYNLDIEERGLVPGHAYTILGVKEVNTGSGTEKLVHIRNPWGNTEWSGDWSDGSKKWTTSLKQQCGQGSKKDDGSFWMSFNDFCKYYLVAGICNLQANYHYSTLHVPKKITQQGPFMSRVQVDANNTHAYIMLHQKNPRIVLKNGNYQKPVVDFIMLVDDKFNYIKANNNQDLNVCIEVTLNKGNYYLISDINFRYVQSQQHCYNLSAYSSTPIGIFPDANVNMEEAFKNGLLSYCKTDSGVSSQNFNGGKLYQSKKSGSEFPFMFALFDNSSGTYDITLTDTFKFNSSKPNAEYYFEGNKAKQSSLSKTIQPGQFDVFCHMPYSFSSLYSYSLKSSAASHKGAAAKKGLANPAGVKNPNASGATVGGSGPQSGVDSGNQGGSSGSSSNDITKAVFSEPAESLDDRGYLKQYIHQTNDGYYIGFENGSQRDMKMQLILEGLYDVNNPNLKNVVFTSNKMSRKVFLLKPKPGYTGNISFMFDNAK